MQFSRFSFLFCVPALFLSACVQTTSDQTSETTRQMIQAAQNPDALARIGQTALNTGDINTALTFYSRATLLSPDRIDLQLGYAQALTTAGKAGDALALLTPLAAKNPDNAQLALVTGRLMIEAGHPRAAVTLLQGALHQAPTNVHILVALGVALDTLGKQQEAQGYYQRALAFNPDDIAARTDMALSLALSGSYPQALGILRLLRGELAGTSETTHSAAVENALALVYGLMGDQTMSSAILRHHLSEQQARENLEFYDTVRRASPPTAPAP